MFGYVKTDNPNMYVKDTVLYKSMYCGLCKGIGCTCGNIARFTLNYDLTFFSVLLHNLSGLDVKLKKEHCIAHWFTKRPVATPDELTKKLGALNVILAYYKLSDDVSDENKGRLKRSFFKKGYKKAKKFAPELDLIVKRNYSKLIELEKSACDSIDIISDPFGNMMKELTISILKDKSSEKVENLAYNLGKWIYLIDAVDDFDKDIKKNNFNVFINIYKDAKTKEELFDKNISDLEFIFSAILSDITEDAKALDYKFNHDLTDNILFNGIREQTKKVLGSK